MLIRPCKPNDAEQILEIYRPFVTDNAVSFELTLPTVQEFSDRITRTLDKWPWLVAEEKGVIAGYAYASAYRSRCAYGWSVESSVYVHPEYRKQGLAKLLYTTLFDWLKKQNIINVYVGITLPNSTSIRIHEKMGFTKIGDFKDVGFKLGKWRDVGWWQLQIQKIEPPRDVISIQQIPGWN